MPPKSPFSTSSPILIRLLGSLEKLSPNFVFEHPNRTPPRWTKKAGKIVFRASMPAVVFDRAASKAARVGAALGRLDAFDAWLCGERELPIPPQVEVRIEHAFEQWSATDLSPKQTKELERSLLRLAEWISHRDRRRQVFADIERAAAVAPYELTQEFRNAYAQAHRLPADWVSGDALSREAKLAFLFAALWWLFELLPSVTALHRCLSNVPGIFAIGDLKSFHRLCRKIGFRLRGRGRPRKQK